MLHIFIETKNTWEQLEVSPNDQNGDPRLQKILGCKFLGCKIFRLQMNFNVAPSFTFK